ncbi:hypothetical protein OSCT_2209 [Oscillochloris trichoides DG-6]|uniref:Uncharacterized protein n=1 Tax=Oscillochloris trichoides DG-6 TaxID=765420 RepID=E1IFV8_9CHLR|nr:hypothetical protein [Oscillochloris trichoides]EFO79916.1 hypothetical protein OSCT_2209 [Oscillochloris trichoides DG-6]
MQTAAILLLLICYGAAGYLAWQQRNPIYLLAILAGHVGAVLLPLWQLLYVGETRLSLATLWSTLSQRPTTTSILIAGWPHALPALMVLLLYLTRWWFPGSVSGLLTYIAFLLYHLLIELIGLQPGLWPVRHSLLPLVPTPLLSALMAALVSYALLYLLLSIYRYAWTSMVLALVPAILVLSLLIYGLLGAPLWIALALDGVPWAIGLGTASALALLLWAIQIVTGGIQRVE